MYSVLVIGAGKFGTHLALSLCKMGNEVMMVDKIEEKINEVADQLTVTEIGDYTIKSNLEALGIEDFDYIFVCTSNFQDSLVIIDHLKNLGAKNVIAKASSEIHERFLLKNGADKIVYPERDFAITTAVEYSNNHIFDYRKLSEDTGIYEIEPPKMWLNKSLMELNVRKAFNVSVLAYKNNGNVIAINDPEYKFKKDEHILVMATSADVAKITK